MSEHVAATSNRNRAILRQIPLFREFDDAACDATIAVLRLRQFSAGDSVFQQGEVGDTMVIVSSGHLRVELDDGRGMRTAIGSISAGEIVGEMAVLDPAPRASCVTAVSDTVVFELNRAGLQELRLTCPPASAAIVSAVINDVTRRLRQINKRIDTLLNPRTSSGAFKPEATGGRAPSEPTEPTSLFSRIWARLSGD
jgi:CRP/FNR family cyclic AMP-dependent transcriptional regulator